MQTRTCFNGGEFSGEMAARCDMDVWMRGCRLLENWEVRQMGGVQRRRGMRGVTRALGAGSRLAVYSAGTVAGWYVVEFAERVVRVLDRAGAVVAMFRSGVDGVPVFRLGAGVRVKQMNRVLMVVSGSSWPMELELAGGVWSLRRMVCKAYPWRYDYERRDRGVRVTAERLLSGAGRYAVAFAEGEDEVERRLVEGDVLRVSYWLEAAEAVERGADVRRRVRVVEGVEACAKGDVVAVHGEEVVRYWVCKKEFPADVYVEGLDDPGCYPDNFEEPEVLSGFDGEVREVVSVQELKTCAKGTKFAVRSGYWEYWTCIKDFGEADMVAGRGYGDYSGHFVRGVTIGEALPCRGKWSFYCSGLWYGSYEVRRSFEGKGADAEWECAGVSRSQLSEPANEVLAGDEGDEECWLQLWLTRSKYLSDDLCDGFPADKCGNRLMVEGYRHDMVLRWDGGEWVCLDRVDVGWSGEREVRDWSWCAWGERYGYPVAVEVFGQRLVFAGTVAQPQTVWMSRTDDLFNFATGDTDDSAIYRTLYTTRQDAICWMLEASNRLMVGTADAEWTLEVPNGGAVTPGSLYASRHGRSGSEPGMMLAVDDKALFVSRGGARLWAYGYSFEVDGCRSTDLSVFAPHIMQQHDGVRGCALLEVPDTVAVFVLGDGQVGLCTYNTLHQVHAWHRWVTEGRVLDVCAPGGDRLWFVVERGGEVWVEAVDGESGWVDRGGRGYVSELVTTALGNVLEERVAKRPKAPVMVLLGEDVATGSVRVAADGGRWMAPAVVQDVLKAGWVELLVANRWEVEHAVGLRMSGVGGSVLALQG